MLLPLQRRAGCCAFANVLRRAWGSGGAVPVHGAVCRSRVCENVSHCPCPALVCSLPSPVQQESYELYHKNLHVTMNH